MNNAVGPAPDLDAYMAAIRGQLLDLSEEEREDLLDDLRQHLQEVAAESEEPLVDRLGPPEGYAAELRATAALPVAPARRWQRAAKACDRLRQHAALATLKTEALHHPTTWWVVRGYLVALLFSIFTQQYGIGWPVPRFANSKILGLAMTAGLVWLSVRVGRAAQRTAAARWAGMGATLAIVLLALPASAQIRFNAGMQAPIDTGVAWSENGLLDTDGNLVTNIYPYDAQGRPLSDVRLFDQHGNPIEIDADYDEESGGEIETSYPLGADGRPLLNVFPQQQALVEGDESDVGDGYDDPNDEPYEEPDWQRRRARVGETPFESVPPIGTARESERPDSPRTGRK